MKTFAFIFARAGSTRIKNKNMKLLNGKPLIYYSIQIAKKIKEIKKIYVSTDSKKIARYARSLGANIIHRPKKLATKNSNELLSWKHSLKFLEKKEIKFDKFVSLPCTAPLRNKSDVIQCLKQLKKDIEIVLTAYSAETSNPFLTKLKKIKDSGYYIVKNKKKLKGPHVYTLTTVAYVTTPEYIKKSKNITDGKVSIVKIPRERAVDVNEKLDFKFVEYLMREKNESKK